MATYLGYYRPNADFLREQGEKARSGDGGQSPALRERVIGLRKQLPKTIKMIGSYGPLGGAGQNRPAVWIAETDDPAELQFINNWYEGFLEFEWVPAVVLGTTAKETTAALDANAGRR